MTIFTAETQRFRRETQRKEKNLGESLRFLCVSAVKYYNRQLCLVLITLNLGFFSACNITATTKNDSIEENAARQLKNETALLQAKNNIEKYRKGEAKIKILDAQGKAVNRAKLEIKQISHEFKFGCYLKIDDLAPAKLPEYERHFAKLFNYAVVGTYWNFTEKRQGNENWSWFERETALSRKLGVRVQAAPVLWGTNEYGTPEWLPRQKDELLPILERRVKSTVMKSNVIDDWEIVNEPLAPKDDFFARNIGSEYIETAFRQARQSAPKKRLLINEFGVFGSVKARISNRERYFNLLDGLIKRNVPIDIIGIQAHAQGDWYEPANVAEQLERYAALGKPIQITEFSVQTVEYDDRKTPLDILGKHRTGVWDAEKQAEFYREFYTVSFGNPQVEAIVTWGLDDERAWLPGIGLINENGEPKPVYKTLERLINQEWTTTINAVTNEQGIYNFRGFYGNYKIKVNAPADSPRQTKFALEKGKTNEWIIRLERLKIGFTVKCRTGCEPVQPPAKRGGEAD